MKRCIRRKNKRTGRVMIPAEGELLLEARETDRQREQLVRLQEHQREQELVPGADEAEHGDGGEPRSGERQDDLMEGAEHGGAVDRRRVLELLRYRLEEAAQEPDVEGKRERRIGDDQRRMR